MTIASCLTRMLSGAAVAAMFVVSPVVFKIDASGITVAQAVALAQINPDPIDGPPDGPDGPGGPGCGDTCGPPDGPIDPPGGPIDPPVCDVDCGPPVDPIDPDDCGIDCGPDVLPIDTPPVDCKRTREGCEPAPVVTPAAKSSSDRDTVPTPKPAVAKADANAEAMDFAKSLACIRPCRVTVMPNGDMTIRINDNQLQNSKKLIDVVFEIKGNVVTVKYVAEDEEVLVNSGKDWGSVAAARQQVAEWVGEV